MESMRSVSLIFDPIDSHERFNSMKRNLLYTLGFTGHFNIGFGFMKVATFSRELADRFYTGLSLFDSSRRKLALVNGFNAGLDPSDSFRPNRVNASDVGFDSIDILVLRRIADLIRGWY